MFVRTRACMQLAGAFAEGGGEPAAAFAFEVCARFALASRVFDSGRMCATPTPVCCSLCDRAQGRAVDDDAGAAALADGAWVAARGAAEDAVVAQVWDRVRREGAGLGPRAA